MSAPRPALSFILLMGLVAMFGDMTYEGVRGLSGPFLATLGASATAVGFIAGLGELLGYALRVVSGRLADRTGRYWTLVTVGYALNAVVVVGLSLSSTWHAAITFLLLERIGKAIRSPARSTLVSYAAHQVGVGKSFGIDEALDQVGAVSGPLITALVLWLARDKPPPIPLQLAFAVLLVPVLANLAVLRLAYRRFPSPESFEPARPSTTPHHSGVFAAYMLAASLMAFGFADWALVSFHAGKTRLLDVGAIPLVYALAMGVDALAALRFGTAFDRHGLAVLSLAALVLAVATPLVFLVDTTGAVLFGVVLWGVAMGAQDSVCKAAVATLVPNAERASAYGRFYAAYGVAWWLGSTLMGWLYDHGRLTLVVLVVLTQLGAAALFVRLGRRLAKR